MSIIKNKGRVLCIKEGSIKVVSKIEEIPKYVNNYKRQEYVDT